MTVRAINWTLAFPLRLSGEVARVVEELAPSSYGTAGMLHESLNQRWPAPQVGGRRVQIPHRMHHPEFSASQVADLSATERLIAGCLFTRHTDGHVRQRAVRGLLVAPEEFVAPYVVQLLGEYVVDIAQDVLGALESRPDGRFLADRLGTFAADNGPFLALTRSRASSYWAEYHRHTWPELATFPAIRALDLIDQAPRLAPRLAHRRP